MLSNILTISLLLCLISAMMSKMWSGQGVSLLPLLAYHSVMDVASHVHIIIIIIMDHCQMDTASVALRSAMDEVTPWMYAICEVCDGG